MCDPFLMRVCSRVKHDTFYNMFRPFKQIQIKISLKLLTSSSMRATFTVLVFQNEKWQSSKLKLYIYIFQDFTQNTIFEEVSIHCFIFLFKFFSDDAGLGNFSVFNCYFFLVRGIFRYANLPFIYTNPEVYASNHTLLEKMQPSRIIYDQIKINKLRGRLIWSNTCLSNEDYGYVFSYHKVSRQPNALPL